MPSLEINLAKIQKNTANLINALNHTKVAAVTKCCQSDAKITQAMICGGVRIIADSYLANLQPLKDMPIKKMLLKAPLKGEPLHALDVIDFTLLSNTNDIQRLIRDYEGKKSIGVILNCETGFGREGLDPKELPEALRLINKKHNFYLAGFATNTACQNGANPINQLNYFTDLIRSFLTSELIISGGSSSVLPWALQNKIPKEINQLRIGEAILLGHDTVSYQPIVNNYTDSFQVKAEVVEISKRKNIWQAVVAIGISYIGAGKLNPCDNKIKINKLYSDYITVTSDQKISEEYVYFKADYYALMALFNSTFVDKMYIDANN